MTIRIHPQGFRTALLKERRPSCGSGQSYDGTFTGTLISGSGVTAELLEKNGIDIDILYRDLDAFVADVASVVEQHQARNGYTTCMWHNLRTCRILFDRNGRLAQAKTRFDVAYPDELRESIILTILGTFVGVPLGIWFHGFIMSVVKVDFVCFQTQISPLSYAIGIAITLLTTLIVDKMLSKKIDRINMAESLKSVE